MKLQSLNARGFGHHFALILVVLSVAVGGTYQLVASHADTVSNTHSPTGSISVDSCSATASGSENDGDRPNDGARVIVTVQGVGGVDINSGNGSWSYAIPANFKDGQNHTIYANGRNVDAAAQNAGTNPALSGSPANYNSSNCAGTTPAPGSPPPANSPPPPPPTNTPGNDSPSGSITIDNCSATASGTESDPDRPNDGARVILTIQGVGGVDINSASHNWSYAIPASFKDGQNHNVYATGRNVDAAAQNAGTNPALSGSPANYNSSNCSSTPPAPTTTSSNPPAGTSAPNGGLPSGTVSVNSCSATASGTESDPDRPNDGARVIITIQGIGSINVDSGNGNWSYAIPASLKDGQNHSINAAGRNVDGATHSTGANPALSGSPAVYNSHDCTTPGIAQQPTAPTGTTSVTVAAASSGCAKDYQKDTAGQCYTTVKPSCPAGATLHTGKDPSTSQPRYFCASSNGTNISAGASGVEPPAVAGFTNGKTIACNLLNNQGVKVTIQAANQAACSSLVNQDIPCGYYDKNYEHVTKDIKRTDCAIALKNQTNPDDKPLACRIVNGDGNYKTVKSTVGSCPSIVTKAERDRNVIVVKSTKVLCDYVDGKGYYFSQALVEKSDCNNKQTHSNDHDCKAYIQQQLGIAGSSAAECIIAHENSKSLPPAKFEACSWHNAEGIPVTVTNLNPTLCEQRQQRERSHGPKTAPVKTSTVATSTPSSAVRNDPDNKRGSSAPKTTTVKAAATPTATNPDCVLHNSKGTPYTSTALNRRDCAQAQQDYKDSVSQARADANKKAADAKTAATAVAHRNSPTVQTNSCSGSNANHPNRSCSTAIWNQGQRD
jgi:hypothetical protein